MLGDCALPKCHTWGNDGKTVTIEGDVNNNCSSFAVEFICFNNDIAFHFNPRFDDGNFVDCNTKLGNQWGKAVRINHMPFRKDEAFEIIITAQGPVFQVSVNGSRIFGYRHSVSYQDIQSLHINGDVTLTDITFSEPPTQLPPDPAPDSATPDYTLPFQRVIHGGISEGKMVTIEGQIYSHCSRFAVNFFCFNNDIAFHFNPRFDKGNVIVCNSMLGNKWGSEERTNHMPFKKDSFFKITINVQGAAFQVSVNEYNILEYRHRVSYQGIQSLQVHGDIILTNVIFSEQPTQMSSTPPPNYIMPFQCAIPGGISDGKTVTIEGLVQSECSRFAVDFVCFNNDIAFHFNPRFNNVIVCNTMLANTWGSEERKNLMPFSRNNPFEITITILKQVFKVSVKGKDILEYHHRVFYQGIKSLHVNGDIILKNVTFSEPTVGIELGPVQ